MSRSLLPLGCVAALGLAAALAIGLQGLLGGGLPAFWLALRSYAALLALCLLGLPILARITGPRLVGAAALAGALAPLLPWLGAPVQETLLALTALGLILAGAWRWWRRGYPGVDRTIALVGLTVLLGVSALFHLIFLHLSMSDVVAEEARLVRAVIGLPSADLSQLCERQGWTCRVAGRAAAGPEAPEAALARVAGREGLETLTLGGLPVLVAWTRSGAEAGQGVTIVAARPLAAAAERRRAFVALIAVPMYLLWGLGGTWLMRFHRRRLSQRAALAMAA